MITTSLSITMPEVVLRDTFLSKLRSSKKLQADLVEFDRMREEDDRRALQWLTESIERFLARRRMEWARKLQKKSLRNGAIDTDSTPGQSGKRQRRRQEGQRQGKRKRQGPRKAGSVSRFYRVQ